MKQHSQLEQISSSPQQSTVHLMPEESGQDEFSWSHTVLLWYVDGFNQIVSQ